MPHESRQADTIEITPAMIEAGVTELERFSGAADDYELVALIYKAMTSSQVCTDTGETQCATLG